MKKTFSLFLCMFVLSGCDSNGGDDNDAQIGYLTHTGIRGLSYQTQSQSGITGERGEFYYYPGEMISFSLAGIPLAEDVPVKSQLSPLDLEPGYAPRLQEGVTRDGLTTHKPVEEELVASANHLINMYRFLLSLDDDEKPENGIFITDEILEEIRSYPMEDPINFHKTTEDFGNPETLTAPENRLIAELCFEDVWQDRECVDPLVGRTILPENEAINYMTDDLNRISGTISNNILLTPFAYEIKPGDNGLRTVKVKQHKERYPIAELEAHSSDETLITIHRVDEDTQEVIFYNSSSTNNAEGTLFINVRLAGDYRWSRKGLSVRVHPEANR